MKGLVQDIEGLATRNEAFRQVHGTAKSCQPVLMRDGDLATRTSGPARDEISPLPLVLGERQQSQSQVVGSVHSNAESVATASAQIARGNQAHSGRTEQQASALRQTAATMEVLRALAHRDPAAKQRNFTVSQWPLGMDLVGGRAEDF